MKAGKGSKKSSGADGVYSLEGTIKQTGALQERNSGIEEITRSAEWADRDGE